METEKSKIEAEHIIEGLELSLQRLGPELIEQVDGLTQKQLKRALKSTINYIYLKKDDTDMNSLGDREKRFLGGMISIVETGVQYSLHIISQLQQERLNKESKDSKQNKTGDKNE